MDLKRPLFWHQGQFLQPQHLQLADRYHESLLAPLREFLQPHFWGVASLEVRESALMNSRLEIVRGEFVFPDGTAASCPGNGVLPSRSFDTAWTDPLRPLNAYVGLRRIGPAENVDVVPKLEELQTGLGRFAATTEPDDVEDQYGKGPNAKVRQLSYVMRIFWESELDQAQGHDLIPLARLERVGGEVKLSGAFAPPVVTIKASEPLRGLIQDVGERLVSRCRQLEAYKNPREAQVGSLDVAFLVFLLALRSLNRYVPAFLHMMEAPNIHPWHVYGLMRQLVGELTTFTDTMSATGERQDGTTALPPYDHTDLWGCFSAAAKLIEQLLESLTLGPDYLIRLEPEGRYLTAQLSPHHFIADATHWLVLHTEAPAEEVLEAVRTSVKLGSTSNMATLVARALPGVPLRHFPSPPPGLPRHAGTTHFLIDRESPHWADIQRSLRVSLLWDGKPDDLSAEIAVLRS